MKRISRETTTGLDSSFHFAVTTSYYDNHCEFQLVEGDIRPEGLQVGSLPPMWPHFAFECGGA